MHSGVQAGISKKISAFSFTKGHIELISKE